MIEQRFLVESIIYSEGFGTVFEATDALKSCKVIVKIVRILVKLQFLECKSVRS